MAENLNISKHPVLLMNALNQTVSFLAFKQQYSIDSFHNSYLRLSKAFDEKGYFCIKKYTPKEVNKYGETAYNFQLYYEEDLNENQMFIMPLANGRIYTHTLSKDKVMAYRHICYTGNAKN